MIKLPVYIERELCCCIKKKADDPAFTVGKASRARCWVLQGISWFLMLRVYILELQVMHSRARTAEK